MSITFTRSYSRASVTKTSDGLQDVVTSVYCALYGVNEDGLQESAGATIDLNPPDPTQFIPFEEITIELLDSWVLPKTAYKELESIVEKAIDARINPVVVIKDLPFA